MKTPTRDEDGSPDPRSIQFSDGSPAVEVDAETGCWIWLGSKMRGYARVRVGKRPSVQAHRWLFECYNGQVSKDLDVGHTCLRRSCVLPTHMVVQTKPQNTRERYQMPQLGETTRGEVEEAILDDKPHSWICTRFGISFWAIRRVAEEIVWKDQYKLSLEVPF